MSGKGSTPRPLSVSAREFADNWARTFGKLRDIESKYFPRLTEAEARAEWERQILEREGQ